MKQFFKFMFASMLGTFLALLFLMFISVSVGAVYDEDLVVGADLLLMVNDMTSRCYK